MYDTDSNGDTEANTVENCDGKRPAVVELFSVFDASECTWELLDCDVDAVVKDVAGVECEKCAVGGELSFEEMASMVVEDYGVVLPDGVVDAAVEEASVREYGDVSDVDDCKKVLYLLKKSAEMKSMSEVDDSLTSDKQSLLNPRVLIRNTYRSVKHLAGKMNTNLQNRHNEVKERLNNESR